MKRVLLNKFLVCILIVIMSCNFVFGNIGFVYAADSGEEEVSMGADGADIVTGLIGILLYPVTIIPTATFIGIGSALQGLLKLNLGKSGSESSSSSITSSNFMTPFDILFNKVPVVDINFFNINEAQGAIKTFREAVAGWYYTMRLLAAMILLVILIYVGVRMAISSIATEKAMYKKMLVDWVTSLVLLFLLHYIMLFTFACNEAIVKALEQVQPVKMDDMINSLIGMCFHFDIVVRTAALIIYGMILFQTISFFVAYVKRMLTIGFLMMIAPLITITYSVDKIGDGKAQALNTWLKEFILNVLLQPFQCILYLAFVSTSFKILLDNNKFEKMSGNNIGKAIFAVMCLHFVKEGEKLIKKIFGFDKASTAGDMAAGAALTSAAIFKGKDAAAKAGGALGKAKNAFKASKAAETMRNSKLGTKIRDTKNAIKEAPKNMAKSVKNSVSDAWEKHKAKRATPAEGSQKVSEAAKNKKENSLEKRAEKLFNKKAAAIKAQGGKEIPSNLMDQCREEIKKKDESKQKRKESIKSYTSDFAKSSVKASGQAISGIYQYAKDNRREIFKKGAKATFGLATAGMMMGGSDFGDISKAVAGYNVGSGLVEGFMQNSVKELQSQAESAAQMIANLTGNGDIQSILANAQTEGANEIEKKLNTAIQEIKKILQENKNRDKIMGMFTDKATGSSAGTVNDAFISKLLTENGVDDPATQAQAMQAFKNYGALLGSQSLANNINQAAGMGIDREKLGRILGDRTTSGASEPLESSEPSQAPEPQSVESTQFVEETEVIEEHMNAEINVSQIAAEVAARLSGNSSNMDPQVLVAQLDRLNDDQKQQVINQINVNAEISDVKNIREVIDRINNG